MALRGIRTEAMSGLERVVMYEAYTQERMATVHQTAAVVFASIDPKKSSEFMSQYMDSIFPEVDLKKSKSTDAKMKELEEFSKHDVKLVPIPGSDGYALQVSPREGK